MVSVTLIQAKIKIYHHTNHKSFKQWGQLNLNTVTYANTYLKKFGLVTYRTELVGAKYRCTRYNIDLILPGRSVVSQFYCSSGSEMLCQLYSVVIIKVYLAALITLILLTEWCISTIQQIVIFFVWYSMIYSLYFTQ